MIGDGLCGVMGLVKGWYVNKFFSSYYLKLLGFIDYKNLNSHVSEIEEHKLKDSIIFRIMTTFHVTYQDNPFIFRSSNISG